jgi:double-stranded uracil-DNA glycosylase
VNGVADHFSSFAPVYDAQCKVLIVGSLPGVTSAGLSEYYAHPRNHFWQIMSLLLNKNLTGLPYSDRLTNLVTHQVGLWDSVRTASRRRSVDSTIAKDAALNALDILVSTLPQLRLIAFNGKTAAVFGKRALGEAVGIPTVLLPSTSPANTLPLGQKLSAWRCITDCLVTTDSPFDHSVAVNA